MNLFSLLQIIGLIVAVSVVGNLTVTHLSPWWLIATLPPAVAVGWVLGSLPYVLGLFFINRSYRKLTDQALLARMNPGHWTETPMLAQEAARRQIDVDLVRQRLEKLMASPRVWDKDYIIKSGWHMGLDLGNVGNNDEEEENAEGVPHS